MDGAVRCYRGIGWFKNRWVLFFVRFVSIMGREGGRGGWVHHFFSSFFMGTQVVVVGWMLLLQG